MRGYFPTPQNLKTTDCNEQTKLSKLIECGECQIWMIYSLSGTRKTSSHWKSLPKPLPRTCRLASMICLRPYIMVLGEQNCLQKEKKQFYFAGQKQALHRSKMGNGEGWWIQTLQIKVSHSEQGGLCWRLVINTILSKWEAPLTFIFLPYSTDSLAGLRPVSFRNPATQLRDFIQPKGNR